MSRNRSLREIADGLPPLNQVTKDGKFVNEYFTNKKGELMMRNAKKDHFREMLNLKNDLRARYPRTLNTIQRNKLSKEEIQVIGSYCEGVHLAVEAFNRKKRVKRLKWIIAGFMWAVLISYILIKHVL